MLISILAKLSSFMWSILAKPMFSDRIESARLVLCAILPLLYFTGFKQFVLEVPEVVVRNNTSSNVWEVKYKKILPQA